MKTFVFPKKYKIFCQTAIFSIFFSLVSVLLFLSRPKKFKLNIQLFGIPRNNILQAQFSLPPAPSWLLCVRVALPLPCVACSENFKIVMYSKARAPTHTQPPIFIDPAKWFTLKYLRCCLHCEIQFVACNGRCAGLTDENFAPRVCARCTPVFPTYLIHKSAALRLYVLLLIMFIRSAPMHSFLRFHISFFFIVTITYFVKFHIFLANFFFFNDNIASYHEN